MTIALLPAGEIDAAPLAALLCDAVNDGASVGFLPPLTVDEAAAYWHGVIAAVAAGERLLLVARAGEETIGTVQLDLCQRANGLHRAEVMRLLVHTTARRRGVGRALMEAAEAEARARGRTLLVLDTRDGDPSCRLYESLGYTRAGVIPRYARSADGRLHATAIYYKELSTL